MYSSCKRFRLACTASKICCEIVVSIYMNEVCKCRAHLATQPFLIDDSIVFRGFPVLVDIHALRSNGAVDLKCYKLS